MKITKEMKIHKLELLLSCALYKTDKFDLDFKKDETWNLIDKIIRLDDYIERVKAKPEEEIETYD